MLVVEVCLATFLDSCEGTSDKETRRESWYGACALSTRPLVAPVFIVTEKMTMALFAFHFISQILLSTVQYSWNNYSTN